MRFAEGKGRREGVPKWAGPYTTEQFQELVDLVERHMADRQLPCRINPRRGLLWFTPPGFPEEKYELRRLAERCARDKRQAWDGLIRKTLDQVIGARTISAITLERLAADWDLAANWLRVRFGRTWLIPAEADVFWWDVAPGLTCALEYGIPHRYWTVPLEHARGWGKSADELFQVAVENLRREKVAYSTGFRGDWGPTLRLEDPMNKYVASHLLVLDAYLDPVPGAGAVLAVPKDTQVTAYIVTGLASEAYLQKEARVTPEFFMEAYHAVSPYLYWWRNGVITPLFSGAPFQDTEFWLPPAFYTVMRELREQAG